MRETITVLTDQKAAAVSAEATALRRLERDIHDGPQQRLVRLAMDLSRARQQLDTDPEALRDTLDEALGQTRETLDELRALSRGIAPPVLADRGLPSALAALAGRCTVPVELAVDPELGTPAGRLDPAVENTAYFAVAEALTNVAKHSGAANCWVTVANGPGRLARADRRRRGRRRARRQGPRPGRAGRPGPRHRRRARRGQPGRRADRDQGGVAVLRVVVADDSVLLREGLVRLLTENGHDVVAAVGDGAVAGQAVEQHRPDVSVVDVRMPPSHTDEGLRAAVEARQLVPGTPVLVLSQYVEVSYADDLLPTGAGGDRLPAQGPGRGRRRVPRRAGPGGRRRHGARPGGGGPAAGAPPPRRPAAGADPARAGGARADGRGPLQRDIARTLVVTDGAVEKHVRNIFTKLTLPPDVEQHRRVLAVLAYLSG